MTEITSPSGQINATDTDLYRIADDRIEIYPEESVIIADDREVQAMPIEVDILTVLAENVDHPVSPPDLAREVWGYPTEGNYLATRVHMSRLRRRLGPELGDLEDGAIITRYGIGYCAVSSLGKQPVSSDDESIFIADKRIAIQPEDCTVIGDGKLISDITETQFRMLSLLASQPDRPVETDTFLTEIWGVADEGTYGSARVLMTKLRRNLGSELGDARSGAIRQRQRVDYYAVTSLKDSL